MRSSFVVSRLHLGALVLVAAPFVLPSAALAGEEGAGEPEKPAAKASEVASTDADSAADGREVDAAGVKLLDAWGKAMHLPAHTKAAAIASTAKATNATFFEGGELTVTTSWKRDGKLELDVELPKTMTDRYPPEALAMTKSMFSTWAREALAPVLIAPQNYAADYHVGIETKKDVTAVKLLPFAERAAAELQLLYFDADGLCQRRIMIPRVDPSDASQQFLVGAEIETTFTYEKAGERSVLKRMNMFTPMGEIVSEYEYYEVTDSIPMLKTLSMSTPFAPDPVVVTFKDYVVDGKPVTADTDGGDEKTDESGGTDTESEDTSDEPAEK